MNKCYPFVAKSLLGNQTNRDELLVAEQAGSEEKTLINETIHWIEENHPIVDNVISPVLGSQSS